MENPAQPAQDPGLQPPTGARPPRSGTYPESGVSGRISGTKPNYPQPPDFELPHEVSRLHMSEPYATSPRLGRPAFVVQLIPGIR
jgi:hypothetical protein